MPYEECPFCGAEVEHRVDDEDPKYVIDFCYNCGQLDHYPDPKKCDPKEVYLSYVCNRCWQYEMGCPDGGKPEAESCEEFKKIANRANDEANQSAYETAFNL